MMFMRVYIENKAVPVTVVDASAPGLSERQDSVSVTVIVRLASILLGLLLGHRLSLAGVAPRFTV